MQVLVRGRRWSEALWLLALGYVLSGAPLLAAELRAGAFAMDVTPEKFPISVNGNLLDYQATSAHDPLHARCLVLDDGTTQLALVTVDSCMLPRDLLDNAKQRAHRLTSIPVAHMLISATHTHEAPTSTPVFGSDAEPEYVAFLTDRIAQGIAKAYEQRVPAKVGWTVGRNPDQVFNRRWKTKPGTVNLDPFGGQTDSVRMNPGFGRTDLIASAGPIDPEITLLSVQTADGKPLALWANYSLHYVGGVTPLSADYFGAYAERMKQLLAPEQTSPVFVAAMTNGTSGDINNVNFGGPAPMRYEPFEKIKLVAESVAQSTVEALGKIEYQTDVTLAAAVAEMQFAVRKPSAEELQKARALLDQIRPEKPKSQVEVYARETVLIDQYPDTVQLELQALRIGGLGICAIPCEVFVEIGLELKQKSPLQPTCTISLANGYNGYLPTPQQHAWGGYETWRARSSYLEREASPKITAKLLELLQQVHGK